MTIVEIYYQEERYNPRIRATIMPAWVAVDSHGNEHLICRGYEADSEEEARAIFESHN